MLRKIFVGVAVGLAALAAYIATRPAHFSISRSRTLAAPPDVVHAHVNDFHKWPAWSPWEKRDPAMTREYSGASAGPGASYSWKGNNDVGEGRMTIIDGRPPQSVTHSARVHQSVRGDEHDPVRFRAERVGHERHLDDERRKQLPQQGVFRVHEHGQLDRGRLRAGAGESGDGYQAGSQ